MIRPGHTSREFILGKRIRHFKPFSLVVVLATFYGLLYHYFINNLFDVKPLGVDENVFSAFVTISRWITDHYAFSTLFLILNSTIASYYVFKKQGYNFAEHLVLNTFYRSLMLIIIIVMFPVAYFRYKSGIGNVAYYAIITQNLDFLIMYWCYAQFFNKISKLKSLGLALLTYLITSVLTVIAGYVFGFIYITYF